MILRNEVGRPEIVYGGWRQKWKNLFHETAVTEVRIQFLDCEFHRNVPVGKTIADGLLIRDGNKCYVELDTGEMSLGKQMRAKWRRYRGVRDFLLVVCLSEKRMHSLISTANDVADIALFTTLDRLKAGQPWTDCQGHTLVL